MCQALFSVFFILPKIAMRQSHYHTHFTGEEPRGSEKESDFAKGS